MNEDQTKHLPIEDRLDSLISVVHQIASDVQGLAKGQQDLRNEFGDLRNEFGDLRNEFGDLRKFVDERLYDTRPMWQRMDEQLRELNANMETGFKKLNHKFDMLNNHFADLYADHRVLASRVDALETPPGKPQG